MIVPRETFGRGLPAPIPLQGDQTTRWSQTGAARSGLCDANDGMSCELDPNVPRGTTRDPKSQSKGLGLD
jgi:hypothetical protein